MPTTALRTWLIVEPDQAAPGFPWPRDAISYHEERATGGFWFETRDGFRRPTPAEAGAVAAWTLAQIEPAGRG